MGVFLVGSPANHDTKNRRFGESAADNVTFKQQVFYSMCWETPQTSAVVMTFSQSACGLIEWWSDWEVFPSRTFLLAPAWFRKYRPRRGLADDLGPLADKPDTVVAIFAPASFMKAIRWRGEQLDATATIIAWLRVSDSKRLVTFGAYTGELESDIALVWRRHHQLCTVL